MAPPLWAPPSQLFARRAQAAPRGADRRPPFPAFVRGLGGRGGLPRWGDRRNLVPGGTSMPADAKTLLRFGYGLVPIVAGADKFTNLLVDWDKYLSPEVEERLPVDGRTFMRLVGVIEIVAGVLVLRRPRLGGAIVSAWLAGITGNLLSMGKYLDIAARDALLAVG